MEAHPPPEFKLDLTTDRSSAKDVLEAVLHVIFFHRVFTAIYPATHEVFDITLPWVSEDEVQTTIDRQTNAFLRKMDYSDGQSSPQSMRKARGTMTVNFLEKKRKKSGWFVTKADEETIWEVWTINVTMTSARSEPEAERNRLAMEQSLENAAMYIMACVNDEKSHIPPITTNDTNPFPFQILVTSKA